VEIYQNCNIFNDGAFEPLKDATSKDEVTIRLEHGKPVRFGIGGHRGVMRDSAGRLLVVDVDQVGEGALLVHDAHDADPSTAFALSRLSHPETLDNTPIGIFRDVKRGTYDSAMSAQIDTAIAKQGVGDLAALLAGRDTWTVR
jgi:2-oxoglutarate ferredoxin oxidoreductase subunit beta